MDVRVTSRGIRNGIWKHPKSQVTLRRPLSDIETPSPRVCTDEEHSFGDVSYGRWRNGLPIFLTNGTSLPCLAGWSSALTTALFFMHEQVFAVMSVTEINTVWSSFTKICRLKAASREDIPPGSLVRLHENGCHSSGKWCNATATEHSMTEKGAGKSTRKILHEFLTITNWKLKQQG